MRSSKLSIPRNQSVSSLAPHYILLCTNHGIHIYEAPVNFLPQLRLIIPLAQWSSSLSYNTQEIVNIVQCQWLYSDLNHFHSRSVRSKLPNSFNNYCLSTSITIDMHVWRPYVVGEPTRREYIYNKCAQTIWFLISNKGMKLIHYSCIPNIFADELGKDIRYDIRFLSKIVGCIRWVDLT